MRKLAKRWSSLVLALVLLLALLPGGAQAEDGEALIEGDYRYTLSGGEATITRYLGSETNVVVPDTLGGCPVTEIGNEAFQNCKTMVSIRISDSVRKTGRQVFLNCENLTDVYFGKSMSSYYNCSFTGCDSLMNIWVDEENTMYTSLDGVLYYSRWYLDRCPNARSSYVIPDGVRTLGNSAFRGCRLTELVIPDSVYRISDLCFLGSRLKTVSIGASLSEIGNRAFDMCSSLESITVDPDNAYYSSVDGVLFDKAQTELIRYPAAKTAEHFSIPNTVTVIDESAFQSCSSLTSVTIPEGVTAIEDYTFENSSSLKSVTIPEGVTSIGYCAFSSCSSMKNVTIPKSVTEIGWYAFDWCTALTSVTIPEGVTEIGMGAFRCCSSLTSVTIPKSVTSISEDVFYECGSLTSVTIPEGVTSIGDHAFFRCSALTSVTIPGSVAEIGWSAFSGCSSLTSVIIPASVMSIGYCAFDGCSSLSDVYYASDSDAWAAVSIDSFNYFLTNATIHYNHTPLSVTGVKASKPAAAPGESVTWTAAAAGGTGTLQYCFYIFKDGSVVSRGDYGTARTCAYTPTAAGTYTIRLYVKDGAGTVKTLDNAGSVKVTAPITISSVTPSKTSADTGTKITWTAAASGGTGSLQYCFYIFKDGSVISRGDYGTARTCAYTPTAAGTYTVRLYVKDGVGTVKTMDNAGSVKVTSPITISSVKANRVLTTVGDTITWTAAASGGDGALKYCFYVLRNGDVVERGSYGTTKTCSYTPASSGTYTVRVYVKDASGAVLSITRAGTEVTA